MAGKVGVATHLDLSVQWLTEQDHWRENHAKWRGLQRGVTVEMLSVQHLCIRVLEKSSAGKHLMFGYFHNFLAGHSF